MLITPTYASLDLLGNEKNNVIGMVIDSWNDSRQDIKNIDILIVDEIYMFNILHMYKLQQIIENTI